LDLSNGRDKSGCTYLKSGALPANVELMFEGRRAVRIEVGSREAGQTASGARVGDSEGRIKAIYKDRIQVEPDQYDPDGHNLVFVPADATDKQYRLLFETDGKKVTGIRAGFRAPVGYVEGCD
jgi:hypothetical protein